MELFWEERCFSEGCLEILEREIGEEIQETDLMSETDFLEILGAERLEASELSLFYLISAELSDF